LKIAAYISSLIITLVCIVLVLEFGLQHFLPEAFRGYLIEQDDSNITWAIGPYEPAQPAGGFNPPVSIVKPPNTIRIVSLGTSGTEGWLTATSVFNKYARPAQAKSLSSYSQAIEFIMSEIAEPTSDKIEVINLGVAAYNITDVIRMLKDSLKLEPDLLIIQIGGNETWTAERAKWSAYFDTDTPYLFIELGYEILTGVQAKWLTLTRGGNPFNPYALFAGKPKPVFLEPAGRAEGLEPRLENYASELERLGRFLQRKGIPALILIPSQNISDFLPFGSMAKTGTSSEQLEKLNQLILQALALQSPDAKDRYLEILQLDDGIAEANFQLGKIYLEENNRDEARIHFWKANDRDLVLKRLPGRFHEISRGFVMNNSLPFLDEMKFFESRSTNGVVGYEWLDDDVHLNRKGQFELGSRIVESILENKLLGDRNYSANILKLPTFDDYNDWTGFDNQAAGDIAYIKATHNYISFGRLRQRLQWDPAPERFLEFILANLRIANDYAPTDQSLLFAASLYAYLGKQDDSRKIIGTLNCRSSGERGAEVRSKMMKIITPQIYGVATPEFEATLQHLLDLEGCGK
jgi:lysophospholipase L1-like esterase